MLEATVLALTAAVLHAGLEPGREGPGRPAGLPRRAVPDRRADRPGRPARAGRHGSGGVALGLPLGPHPHPLLPAARPLLPLRRLLARLPPGPRRWRAGGRARRRDPPGRPPAARWPGWPSPSWPAGWPRSPRRRAARPCGPRSRLAAVIGTYTLVDAHGARISHAASYGFATLAADAVTAALVLTFSRRWVIAGQVARSAPAAVLRGGPRRGRRLRPRPGRGPPRPGRVRHRAARVVGRDRRVRRVAAAARAAGQAARGLVVRRALRPRAPDRRRLTCR